MAIRWAHPKYFATFEQGWMAIRWAHPRFLAKQFTGVDGHTVGTSQTPCKTIYQIEHYRNVTKLSVIGHS